MSAQAARADATLEQAAASAVPRAVLTQDAGRNGTAASFGAPVGDDRRLVTLRWRLPAVLTDASGGLAPFTGTFTQATALPGGVSLAVEPTEGLSALIPQLALGEPHKLAYGQLGALSYTLGHGSIVHAYTNAPEGSVRRIGALGEVNLAGASVGAIVGNVWDAPSFVAARVAARPILWFVAPDAAFQPNEFDLDPRTEIAGVWVTGLSIASDLAAPTTGTPGTVVVAGWDNEAAFLDNQLVKAILHVDTNVMRADLPGTGAASTTGFGVHPGASFMFDVLGARVDARFATDVATAGYQPRYFDRLYALERSSSLVTGRPKATLARPASWGTQARVSAGFLEMCDAFVAFEDQRAFSAGDGPAVTTGTVGAHAFVGMFGALVTASQTGLFDRPLGGAGLVVVGEGRIGLLFNTLHLVGRTWRMHVPSALEPTGYVVDAGTNVGLEVNLDVL